MNKNRMAALALATAALTTTTASALPAHASPAASPAAEATTARTAAAADDVGNRITLGSGSLTIASQVLKVVERYVSANDNRSGWVQALQNEAWYEFDEGKNVMVIKADQVDDDSLEGVELDATYSTEGVPDMRLIVFDSGTVTNTGDGGYINWAFRGWYDRDDMTVDFHQP